MPRGAKVRWFFAGVAVAAVGTVVILQAARGLRHLHAMASSEVCGSSLKQVGMALAAYSSREGALPPSLEVLVFAGDLSPEILTCPVSKERYVYFYEENRASMPGWSAAVVAGEQPRSPLVAERGFPHHFPDTSVRPARHVKHVLAADGGVMGVSAEELVEHLEDGNGEFYDYLWSLVRPHTEDPPPESGPEE